MGTIWIFVCYVRRLRLRQGKMQEFLGLKGGGGSWFANMGFNLNQAHEAERTVFPIPQAFSMCRCRLWHKRKHKGYSTNSAISGVASPTIQSRYAKFQVITLFTSLQIDCFHSQWTVNICIAGLNGRAGYATECNEHFMNTFTINKACWQ